MKSLFIDTSSFFMIVAILEEEKVLYSFKEKIKVDMASRIIPTIEKAFEEVPFSISDIDKIFVVNGPGSFTGIRVGITAAKLIAWALKKEIVTISSLEFMATTKVNTEYKVVAIDARRGNIYGGVYDGDMNVVLKDQYLPFSNLTSYLDKGTLISRDSLEESIFPDEDIPLIISRHKADKSLNPHEVNPNYLKLTEAEEKKLAGV